MARSGYNFKWMLAVGSTLEAAHALSERRHRERQISPNIVVNAKTYVVFNDDRLIATASIISPLDEHLPCMEVYKSVYPYYVERSLSLGRPAKMVEVGALDTDEESVRCALYVMQHIGAEIIKDRVDDVFADIHPRHQQFYDRFWGMQVFAPVDEPFLKHPKDGQSAVCMHYDVLADPKRWLEKLTQAERGWRS